MMKKFSAILFCLFIVLAILPVNTTLANNKTLPIIIGVPLPLSGNLQDLGIMMKNSMEMAKKNINKKGGINGRKLNIIYADTHGTIVNAENAIKKLVVQDKSVMLVGGYASTPTYYMAKSAEKFDIPFLICTASGDIITQEKWKNIYRLNPPISEYASSLETFLIKNIKPKSMSIIYENSMYGTNGATSMNGFCNKNKIEVINLIGYNKNISDFSYYKTLIEPLLKQPPDVIYMVSYLNDAINLVKAIKQLKLNSILCGGGGGFTQPEFIYETKDASNHLLTATLWSHQLRYKGAKTYYDEYKKSYNEAPDYHGAEAYSALLVAANALKRVSSFKPAYIRAALSRTFLETPFGPVKFYNYESYENQNSVRTQVMQIYNGKTSIVWPLDLETSPYIPPPKR